MNNLAAVYLILLAASAHGGHKPAVTRPIAVAQKSTVIRIATTEPRKANRAG